MEFSEQIVVTLERILDEQRRTNELLERMLHPARPVEIVQQVSGPRHPRVGDPADNVRELLARYDEENHPGMRRCPRCVGGRVQVRGVAQPCNMCEGGGYVTEAAYRDWEMS